MRSISPDYGQIPYLLSAGINHIAGQIQSPFGIFATISAVPYLKLYSFFICNLALLIALGPDLMTG